MTEETSEVFRSNAPKEMGINEGSDTKREKLAEGPTELHQVTDHNVTGTQGESELINVDIAKHVDKTSAEAASAKQADQAEAPVVTPVAPSVGPEMIKKDDAIPWALSINLGERIKELESQNASVNQELDALEAASQKLAKRIGK
jgi:hypothetical protein